MDRGDPQRVKGHRKGKAENSRGKRDCILGNAISPFPQALYPRMGKKYQNIETHIKV